jgi:hypothetical protein
MRRFSIACSLVATLAFTTPAPAAEWNAITPGTSTLQVVRAQLGEPSTKQTLKVEGYDTVQWVYEGARAPRGLRRVLVDFGLLTPGGYRAEVVRVLTLEPAPGMFTQRTIEVGWGPPNRIGKQGDTPVMFYEAGLLVLLDGEGRVAQRMIFTPPQPPSRD